MNHFCALSLASFFFISSLPAQEKGKVWTTYKSALAADPDFSIQGEYSSADIEMAVQVVALGAGKFDAYFLTGGLPGDGWDRSKARVKIFGELTGNSVFFKNDDISAVLKDSKVTVTQGAVSSILTRVERKSPTLNSKAPEGALVLFDGKNADQWHGGKIKDGLLLHGTKSKEKFQNYHLHLEFMTPYRPYDRGQKRGNSGVYHQSRYETQVLDSFALEGQWNEAGGIYRIAKPRLNMCFPPLQWQTYDVDFTAAQYENAKKIKNASMTVKLNGVIIHENVELPKSTTASPLKESPEPGPIYLQNHGNPVFYKNIWIIKK
jgi:hypothetical protein